MINLLIKTGNKKEAKYTLFDDDLPVTIGRNMSNTITVFDQNMSRVHINIYKEEGRYILEDNNSTNGTFINNNAITKCIIKKGLEVHVGMTIIVVQSFSGSYIGDKTKNTQLKINQAKDNLSNYTINYSMIPEEVSSIDIDIDINDFGSNDTVKLKNAYNRLKVLYELSSEFRINEDMPNLLSKILEHILDVTKADRGFIMLRDTESGELENPVVYSRRGIYKDDGFAISQSIIDHVMKTGKCLITTDAMHDKRLVSSDSVIDYNIRSAMCVPIKGKENIIGIMHVDTAFETLCFSKDDLELLTILCSEIGLSIENTRLYSNLKEAFHELKERQAQLIESKKMGAIGQLASGIVHEINNPLTGIVGYSEMISEYFKSESLTLENIKICAGYVEVIQREAQRCQKITQDLLQLSRKRKSKMAKVEIDSVIKAALNISYYYIEKEKISIALELEPELPQITADSNQLQQVFLNLIINAKDAMYNGGNLTISAKSLNRNFIEISFKDTGCGIPENKLKDIFQPLFTTKEEGKGTGLGLSVSKDIIEKHNGAITVKSVLAQGTTFRIKLPTKQLEDTMPIDCKHL